MEKYMILKTFMQENNVTAFEIIPDVLILNVVVGEAVHALNVDTSNIQNGTQLVRVSDYAVEGDTLTVAGMSLNTVETEMLGLDLI